MNYADYDLTKTEDCVRFMIDTDELFGDARASVSAYEYLAKMEKAAAFIAASGSSAAEKEARALSSAAYADAISKLNAITRERDIIAAKRQTAALQVEIWRTKSANRRIGNV